MDKEIWLYIALAGLAWWWLTRKEEPEKVSQQATPVTKQVQGFSDMAEDLRPNYMSIDAFPLGAFAKW